MEKAGYGDKFNEHVFDVICKHLAVALYAEGDQEISKHIKDSLIEAASSASGVDVGQEIAKIDGQENEEQAEKRELKLYKR